MPSRVAWTTPLVVLAAIVCGRAVAFQPATGDTIDLAGQVELSRLVDLAARRLRLNVDYDPAVLKGTATLRLEGPLSDQDLWLLVNRLLAARGLTTVRAAGEAAFSVVKITDAPGLVRADEPAPGSAPAGFKAASVTLEHRAAKEVVETVTKLLSKPSGSVTPLGDGRLLLIIDLAERVDAAVALVQRLDTPAAAIVKEVQVRNLPGQSLAALAAQVIAKRELVTGEKVPGEVLPSPNPSAVLLITPTDREAYWLGLVASLDQRQQVATQSYVPKTFALKEVAQLVEQTVKDNPGFPTDERFRIVTDELTGSLIITATPAQHEQVRTLVDHLNQSPASPARPVRSFVIKNRAVQDLAAVLERLLSAGVIGAAGTEGAPPASSPPPDLQPWPPPAPTTAQPKPATTAPSVAPSPGPRAGTPSSPKGTGAAPTSAPIVSLTTDEASNTLIVMAELQVLAQIEELLRTLDVRQPQVMLEVLIVSLSRSQTLDLGVELQEIQISGDVRIRLSSLFGLSAAPAAGGGAPAAGLGFTGSVLSPGDFSILIRALETINNGRSLSMPHVLVANNQQGTIDSTLEIPFAATNASNTVTTTSLGGTKPAGTQVSIKPQIGSGDHLTLDYSVSLSSFTGAASSPNLPPPRQENKVQSMATIPDGYTVAVGGIELTTEGVGVSQVPFLGRIPILGEAFKNRSKNTSNTRFYVFIRASILRSTSFEDLKYLSDLSAAAAGVDDGFPEVHPRVIP